MTKFIIRRLLLAIPVIFLMVLVTFVLVHAMPGGPFDSVGQRAMPEHTKLLLERRYGLDKPLYEQFFTYTFNLLKGDFGCANVPSFDPIGIDVCCAWFCDRNPCRYYCRPVP